MTEFMHTQKSDPYAQLKAIDDVIVEIKKYSTNQDKTLPDLLHDLEAAQNTALTSLDNFLNIRDYEKGFVRAIQHYKKHSYARAKVCYNLLGVREWDKPFYKKVLKLCSGESLNDYPTGPKTDVLNATVFELPQEKRACIFRNYRRDNLVFEKLSGTAKDIKRWDYLR